MSGNFNRKDYGDYFRALEQQLNKKPESDASAPEPKPRKKRSGIYCVLRLRKSVLAVILAVVLVATACISFNIADTGKVTETESITSKKSDSANREEAKVPKKISYTLSDPTLEIPQTNDAKAVVIIDKSTNTVVAQRNMHQRVYPASTTKIMTLLVAVENLKSLEDTFTITLAITDPLFIAGASVAGFLNNETITVADLLYGMILPSGADGAMGLAIKIAGDEEGFVKLMNQKVKELGLKNTHFTNVSGLHNEQNYSSAYDMAIILDAALQNEVCKEILSSYQYTTSVTPQHPEGIRLSSTLFSYMYGNEPETSTILGGKTGFVNESGYCIASYGENNANKTPYIVVTMGNSARWPAFYGQIDLYKQFAK